jgi:hypothetical protein
LSSKVILLSLVNLYPFVGQTNPLRPCAVLRRGWLLQAHAPDRQPHPCMSLLSPLCAINFSACPFCPDLPQKTTGYKPHVTLTLEINLPHISCPLATNTLACQRLMPNTLTHNRCLALLAIRPSVLAQTLGLAGQFPYVSQASGAMPQHNIEPFIHGPQCPMPPSKVPDIFLDYVVQVSTH